MKLLWVCWKVAVVEQTGAEEVEVDEAVAEADEPTELDGA